MSAPTAVILTPGYLTRLRWGLGIAVFCLIIQTLEVAILLALNGASTASAAPSQSPNVSGIVLELVGLAGWWVFATPTPAIGEVPARGGVAWLVRFSLLFLAAYSVYTLFVPGPPPRDNPSAIAAAMTWGVFSFAASLTFFYGTLVLIRRVGAAMADTWVQRHALFCMIALPVVFLIGVAGAAIFVGVLMTGIARSNVTGASQPIDPAPPAGLMYAFIALMGLSLLWYLVFAVRTWWRIMQWGRPDPYALMASRYG